MLYRAKQAILPSPAPAPALPCPSTHPEPIMKLLAALLLASSTAQAGVVYNWQTIGGSERELVGQLEFSLDAWNAGAVNYVYDIYPPFPCIEACSEEALAVPDAPVIRFTFNAIGADVGGGVYLNYPAGLVGQEDENGSEYELALEPMLRGNIYGSGTGNYLVMHSDADIWSMEWYNFDGTGSPCKLEDDNSRCEGVTGRWVLAQSSLEAQARAAVPIPGTLALVGLGLVLARRPRRWC